MLQWHTPNIVGANSVVVVVVSHEDDKKRSGEMYRD